jgi:hypothetical protein
MNTQRAVVVVLLLAGTAGAAFAIGTETGRKALSDVTDAIKNLFVNRGQRNCNPGNIRRVPGQTWNGSYTSQEQCEAAGRVWDADFEVFYSFADGERALGHVLSTYGSAYGLNTVRLIVSRYAPPAENDTDSYVQFVATQLNVAPDTIIDVQESLPTLAGAIMVRETGFTDSFDNIYNAVYS